MLIELPFKTNSWYRLKRGSIGYLGLRTKEFTFKLKSHVTLY